MAQAIRNLQLFRNGNIITGSVSYVKQSVETMFANGTLVLRDGEPISVRYRLEREGEIKGLFGVAYVNSQNAQDKKILWEDADWTDVSIVTYPTADEYVTLNYTYDNATKQYELVVDSNVVMLADACDCALEVTGIADKTSLYWPVDCESESPEYEEVHVGDIVRCCGENNFYISDGEGGYAVANGYAMEPGGKFNDNDGEYQYAFYEASWTGLADACDVKQNIYRYNVVSGDNIVTISTSGGQTSNGFPLTTFTVTISTENLPSAPNYTIGTTTTSQGYLKTYALFKDGVQVANSTIDIPKDFLVRSASVIEVVEYNNQYYDATDTGHENPLPVSAAGPYIDFVINVKSGDPETPEHIYVPLTSLVDIYTAGDGITISTTNIVSARPSNDTGNMLVISQNDGGLFVPAGDTIVDVRNIDSVCQPGQTNVTYGYITGTGYVELDSDGQGGWEYNGSPYTGHVTETVECGHRYLIVRTSSGNMYITNNDTSSDVHVSNFAIATNNNDEDVLRITMNDNTIYDVLVSDINPTIPAATVNWNTANDTMSIGTEGIFTQLALGTIEAYIDNFDCGTFTIQ